MPNDLTDLNKISTSIKKRNTSSKEHASSDKPIHTNRKMKVICVGAGASGLCFAYKLQRSFENFELTIYDKNAQVSGTWFENTYPGCQCDFPSVNYVYTFEPKPNFTSVYATASEIREYFEDFKTKYELDKFCKLWHKVIGAQWSNQKARWDVQVQELSSQQVIHDSCDILINACGYLNAWRWPTIPGLEAFKGPLVHSANWQDNVEIKGKCVGLIGNGSSAIQILPSLQPEVKKLTTFVRSPTWVSPPYGLEQKTYSREELEAFKNKPGALLNLRKENEKRINGFFDAVFADSAPQAGLRSAITTQMKDKMKSSYLEANLIPRWGVGCRRLTPGTNYLESLRAPNVEVAFGECEKITERGVVVEGMEYILDVLICATGFDTSYKPSFPIIGFEGRNLQEDWALEAKSYLGIAASGFPNYMMFVGPNSPVANGSLLPAIECQADYLLRLCNRWQTENIVSFCPKKDAVEDFNRYADTFMKKTVWDDNCRSWFKKNSVGRNTALWPGSTLHYLEALSDLRADDWNIVYRGNRFAWLGNGYSQTETLIDGDLSYYIQETDQSAFLGTAKRIKATRRRKSSTTALCPE